MKTLAVGEVVETPPSATQRAAQPVTTTHLSYFSRMTDSTTFGQQALDELQRRGSEQAGRVGAVVEGEVWIQGFIDLHAPEAVRILDFPHAASYVQTIGVTTGQDAATIATLRHDLKHQGASAIMPTLRAWVAAHPHPDETLWGALHYLETRIAQMADPAFQAVGWPLGSGSVESANKLVVEARLKGSGRHWAREHVNPMLALRTAACNDRWDETWSQITTERQQQAWRRRVEQHAARQARRAAAAAPPPVELAPPPEGPDPPPALDAAPAPAPAEPEPRKPHKPAANHPWRRAWSVRQQRQPAEAA